MARLSQRARNALGPEAFAIPEARMYPIHDEGHAREALALAHLHPEWEKRIRAAVHARYPHLGVTNV